MPLNSRDAEMQRTVMKSEMAQFQKRLCEVVMVAKFGTNRWFYIESGLSKISAGCTAPQREREVSEAAIEGVILCLHWVYDISLRLRCERLRLPRGVSLPPDIQISPLLLTGKFSSAIGTGHLGPV